MRFHSFESYRSSVHVHKLSVSQLLLGLPSAAYHFLARFFVNNGGWLSRGSDLCVGIAFAPILYQDMICLRVLHYGFFSIFVMAHSSQSMDQRVRRIVFSCGERVQHDVRQCACHFQPFQVHSVLVPSVPALWTIRPRSWYSQDVSVCAVWCRSCGMMHTHTIRL